MDRSKVGITVAGSLIADIFYKIDTYPDPGKLTYIRERSRHLGGSGNMIQDLAKIDPGLPIKVSGVIGIGTNGRMIMKALSEYPNVDNENITKEGESSMTLVMNASDTRQRTFFFQPAASEIYGEEHIDWEHIDARIFHLEYLLSLKKMDSADPEYGTHGARVLCEAQRRGMKTSIDIVSEQSDRAERIVSAALKYTDYCTINEVEAEAVTGVTLMENDTLVEEHMEEALKGLAEKGVREWAVIHSPACSFGLDVKNGELIRSPSLQLPKNYIKGTNGAGDAYCSGILYGAYQGWDLEKSMRFASASAAASLSEVNGFDGMRPAEKIWELEKWYGKDGE